MRLSNNVTYAFLPLNVKICGRSTALNTDILSLIFPHFFPQHIFPHSLRHRLLFSVKNMCELIFSPFLLFTVPKNLIFFSLIICSNRSFTRFLYFNLRNWVTHGMLLNYVTNYVYVEGLVSIILTKENFARQPWSIYPDFLTSCRMHVWQDFGLPFEHRSSVSCAFYC